MYLKYNYDRNIIYCNFKKFSSFLFTLFFFNWSASISNCYSAGQSIVINIFIKVKLTLKLKLCYVTATVQNIVFI